MTQALVPTPEEALCQVCWRLYGNYDYTAAPRYLERMVHEMRKLIDTDVVVECGSGLTTEIAVAVRPDIKYIALEHDQRYIRDGWPIVYCPLVEFDSYSWYGMPAELDDCEGRVRLVICDGPPGNTLGGRIGAMGHLYDYLQQEYVILLDDVNREGEMRVLKSWASQFRMKYTIVDAEKGRQFAVIEGRK